MSGFEILAAVTTVAGAGLSAYGAIEGGKAAQEAADAEALWMQRRAEEERGAASAAAAAKDKQTKLLMSRQLAVAAASGGGASDPTVVDLMAEAAGEGNVQARGAMWEGQNRAEGLTYQAALKRMEGQEAVRASYIKAGSSILSGMSSFSKYKAGIPTFGKQEEEELDFFKRNPYGFKGSY